MTKWVLQCTVCGEKRVLDVGFDLSEFKQLHVYCKNCKATRPHLILGVGEETISL